MKHLNDFLKFESMIQSKSLDQMKKVSDILGNMDIGKRVSDDSFGNGTTKRDIIQTNVQTYTDFLNEPFYNNQNRDPWDKRNKK